MFKAIRYGTEKYGIVIYNTVKCNIVILLFYIVISI